MKPKVDIDKKIVQQKENLTDRLLSEIKLPVSSLKKISFNYDNYTGVFILTISGSKIKQFLNFKFEENNFIWNIESIKNNLDSEWGNIYEKYKSKILAKIQKELNTNVENMEFSTGKKNILYVVEKGGKKNRITCEFCNNQWTVSK